MRANKDERGVGRMVTNNYDGNGNITSTYVSTIQTYYDIINGGLLNPGDKIHPTGFSYDATRRDFLKGSRKTYFANSGQLFIEQTGNLDGNDAYAQLEDSFTDRANYCYNRALERLNEKVRGSLDLSVSFAEFGQTARLAQSLNKLDTYLKPFLASARNPKFRLYKDVKEVGQFVAGKLLEWQYGIRPLLQDIYGAVDELYRSEIRKLAIVKSSYTERTNGPYPLRDWISNQIGKAKVDGNTLQGCQFHLCFVPPTNTFNASRWASLNPLSIAWELTTLSFVVDWLYNIGGYLRSLETAMLYSPNFHSGYYTELWVRSGSYNGKVRSRPAFGYWTEMSGVSSFKLTRFSRTVLGDYPLPRKPAFSIDLGTERLLSAAALLAQAIPRGKK